MIKIKSSCLILLCACMFLLIPTIVSSLSVDQTRDEVILWESFENGFPPENWTNTGWLDSLYGEPYHGDHWVYSWSFDDVLTTPTLLFQYNTTLTFWYAAESMSHPEELEVWIDGFDDGDLVWHHHYFTHTSYQMATVDLSNYSGYHMISFVARTDGFYGEMLDAITVTTLPTIYVDDDKDPLWYDATHVKTIQEGIDNASSGGVVFVYNGTYYEYVTINKTVDLIGENKENTILGSTKSLDTKSTLIDEGFEHGFPPDEWTNNGWLDSLYGFAHSGAHWAYSYTMNSTLATPSVRISLNPQLSFWYAAEDSDHPMDLEIYCKGDLIWSDYGYTHTSYQQEIIPLDPYQGLNVVIEFVGKTDGYYGQCIDDVLITDEEPYIRDFIMITADNVSVSNFTIANSPPFNRGIYVEAGHALIFNNTISNHYRGISVVDSSNNQIYDNSLVNNEFGIEFLFSSANSSIHGNMISNNSGLGIGFYSGTSGNLVFNNYITNNSYNDSGNNMWNISKIAGINIIGGPYLGGNYWDDYGGYDTDSDGIGNVFIPHGPDDYLPLTNVQLGNDQSVFDRGFPIRHAVDGDWAGAQDFTPTFNSVSKVEIYTRTFGSPEFDLTIELRLDGPQGTLLDSMTFTPAEVGTSWNWLEVDFDDQNIGIGSDVFIVTPPAPSGVTTSFGYEWGYAFGNQYDDGSFWFTRDGGNLWRDLPSMYEFVFRTFGYN